MLPLEQLEKEITRLKNENAFLQTKMANHEDLLKENVKLAQLCLTNKEGLSQAQKSINEYKKQRAQLKEECKNLKDENTSLAKKSTDALAVNTVLAKQLADVLAEIQRLKEAQNAIEAKSKQTEAYQKQQLAKLQAIESNPVLSSMVKSLQIK